VPWVAAHHSNTIFVTAIAITASKTNKEMQNETRMGGCWVESVVHVPCCLPKKQVCALLLLACYY
jgi:hypothetical protein